MMLFLVCSVLVIQCIFGNPVEEGVNTNQELAFDKGLNEPSEVILMREPKWDSYFDNEDNNGYFDDWFGWIKPSKTTKKPTLQQRVQTLELRQKVLFDLVRCETLDEDSCTHLLARAEVLFKVLPKKKGTKKPKKKPHTLHHDDPEDESENDPEEESDAAPNTTTRRPNMTTPRTPAPTSPTTEDSSETTSTSTQPTTTSTQPTTSSTQQTTSSTQPTTSTEENAEE